MSMIRLTRLIPLLAALAALLAPLAAPAQQGGPFAPRVIVNDRAITNWEVEQRILLMRALNSPGDIAQEALSDLIDNRLQLAAAREAGIEISEEALSAGITEFAARAELTGDQFIAALGQQGVAPETFRDFIRAGLAWRELVRGRFGPRSQVTEAEIDRAMALSARKGGARILISEIILRADTPEYAAQAKALAERLSQQINSPQAFAAAAREYSVSGTRDRGGRVDWLDLAALPPAIAAQILVLGPGEVTDPIPLGQAIGLFQLRAIQETEAKAPETLAVDYAQFFLPGGDAAAAEKLRNAVDTCDDFYGIAKGLPEERLRREVLPVRDMPQALAMELARLDPDESTVMASGTGLSVLMLCGRTPVLGAEDAQQSRDQLRVQLVNQRITSYAESYLAELKAEAIIRYP